MSATRSPRARRLIQGALGSSAGVALLASCSGHRVIDWGPPPPLSDVNSSMIAIPPGGFAMGSDSGDEDERPVHYVNVAAFAIDRTEVTVRAYRRCMVHGACSPTASGGYCNLERPPLGSAAALPINCVDWNQAVAFCAFRNARLPTEAEWEYAARGDDGRTYPWGDAKPSGQVCWDGVGSDLGAGRRRGTCTVGSHPAGQSAFGLEDMAGNVWEWTNSFYSAGYDKPPASHRVVRGGTWFGYARADLRSSLRFRLPGETRDYGVGFRCAVST